MVKRDGAALVDELITCSGPGRWNRDVMVKNVRAQGNEYVNWVEDMLGECQRASALVSTATPARGLSQDSLELLGAYHELLRFKDEPWFHEYCYSQASPARQWARYVNGLGSIDTLVETGISGSDLWSMGWDYCNNEGRETRGTKAKQGFMKAEWLDYRPIPTLVLHV